MVVPLVCNSPASVTQPLRRVGVGIDTSRYGHYAVFLRDCQQPAAAELAFAESAAGYAQLRQRLNRLAEPGPSVLHVRLDVAGQYADNLLHFLRGLAWPGVMLEISAAIPSATRTTAQRSSARRSPIRSRPARRPATRSTNDRPRRWPSRRNCASCGRLPVDCKPRSGNAPG